METDIDSNLLVIPGSGGPEDTYVPFEGAVDYTGEAHEGTDIYYVGTGARREQIIVIDAGHQAEGSSAKEPNGPGSEEMKAEVSWGAEGAYSGDEHALNLEVALLLRDELIARGYSVVMIRETANVNISNMARAEIANKYNAAAYVRIHANFYEDTTMQGAMTICHSENNPYPDCAATYDESRLLSERILQAFCKTTGMQQMEIREMDDLTGTNWSKVPTTLVEMGFLSNKSDDMLMATKYFKEQAAKGMADGLDAYFTIMDSRVEAQSEQAAAREEAEAVEP
ncbi:MAG: N-acetylmuramoyl-L-alanine amidase [Clostridia bacterium]|nr:N-acetylmuramoyl-L-alanine amidase [Clostridia bacterium]